MAAAAPRDPFPSSPALHDGRRGLQHRGRARGGVPFVFDPLQIKQREQLLLPQPAAGYIPQHRDGVGNATGFQVNTAE